MDTNNLTCPYCKITIMPQRPRSMCPFCGNFYNSDFGISLSSRNNSIDENTDTLRLPRIDSNRQQVLRVTGFGPFLTDGLGVIHTYITGLLFRPSDEPSIYLTLPSIRNQQVNGLESDYVVKNKIKPYDINKKFPELFRSSNDDGINRSSFSSNISYPKREISIEKFKSEIIKANETGDFSILHDFYKRTFSSFIELNALFKENPDNDGAKLTDPELNIELLFIIYDELNDMPSFISKAVLKDIINSLSSKAELKAKDETRALFILLLNPLFTFQSSYSVFAHLFKRIVNLNIGDHQLLIHWFLNLEQERFRTLIKRILQFITVREFPPTNYHKLPSINKSKWWIPCATRILALLNAANNKSNPSKISYTDFYNYALDHINLMAEYYRWQNPSKSNKFSYCQYPFILSIVAKKTILQRDSEQQMILNARKSLLNRAVVQQIPDIDVFFLNLNIRRSHLVKDSLNEIGKKQNDLKKKLKVTFVGEPGLDMGGLTKEWFLLLIKQIFHVDYGMFAYHSKARCYWFSTTQNGNLKEYHLIGVLMGLAVYNSIILDLSFPTVCFKKLLSPPVLPDDDDYDSIGICDVTIDDFSEVMPDVGIGLKELLDYEGNVEEDFCMTFQTSIEEFGKVKTHVLKPGGQEIPVTNSNREEYVNLYMDLILNKAIYHSFKAFYLGFHSVCSSNALILMRPEEVEMLVCGCPTIDIEELKKVTLYDGYYEDDYLIREFWFILKSFDIDMQKQFLRFTTGSDRVPVGGMSEMTLKISASNNTEMLPISHTCFNQLVLPKYRNKEILKEKLVIAISNAEGFGLE